jgi:hypothetical protein
VGGIAYPMNMTRLFEKALEAVLRLPPFFRQKSENRAREIAGEGANHEILKHAHRLAEAQIDVDSSRPAEQSEDWPWS